MKDLFSNLYKMFNKKQKIKVFILYIMMIIGAIFETFSISMIFPFVSLIIDTSTIYSNKLINSIYTYFNFQSTSSFLITFGIVLVLFYLFKNAYLYFSNYIQYRFVANNRVYLSTKLLKQYLCKPYSFYLSNNSATIIRNINTDVTNVFTLLSTLLQFLTEIVTSVGIVIILLIIDARMAILISMLLLFTFVVLKRMLEPIQSKTGIEVRKNEAEMMKWLNQITHGFKEIKIARCEGYFYEQYKNSATISAKAIQKFNVVNIIPQLAIEIIFIVGIIGYILFLIITNQNLSLLIPQISSFAMGAIRLLPVINRTSRYISQINHLKPSLEKVINDLNINNNDFDYKAEKHLAPLQECISIEDLSFAYEESNCNVLTNINLKIPLKSCIGIIGTSGAGKSTFIDILLGLLPITHGKITVDGKDIHEEELQWRSRIGYISQSLYLIEDTIERNIAFGLDNKDIDQDRLNYVIDITELRDFINNLPKKEKTRIGEFGSKLSGGQKQRICIARALYHNPEVLILDEATSALDSETENMIMNNLMNFKDVKTIIIIAHKIQTLKQCDKIYEIKNGEMSLVYLEDE